MAGEIETSLHRREEPTRRDPVSSLTSEITQKFVPSKASSRRKARVLMRTRPFVPLATLMEGNDR